MRALYAASVGEADDKTLTFHEKYSIFQRVPKKFLWAVYSERCPRSFTVARIELMEQHDPDIIRKIFEFDCGRKEAAHVPPALHEKRVFKLVVEMLHVALGCRVTEAWCQLAISESGVVDWQHGVYREVVLPDEESKLGTRTYSRAGEAEPALMPEGYVSEIQGEALVNKNWKDLVANITLQLTDFSLNKLWPHSTTYEVLTAAYLDGVVLKADLVTPA